MLCDNFRAIVVTNDDMVLFVIYLWYKLKNLISGTKTANGHMEVKLKKKCKFRDYNHLFASLVVTFNP